MPTDALRTASHRVGDTRVAQREPVAPSHHRDGPTCRFQGRPHGDASRTVPGLPEPSGHGGAFGDSPVTSCPAARVLQCPAGPSTRPRLRALHNRDIVWAGEGGEFCMKKTRLCDHNRAPLYPGAPPERGVGWGAAQTDVKAWGERGADVRVALSTNKSLVMPSRLGEGGGPQGGGCTRVLIRCLLGTVLPGGLVLS